MIEIADVCGLCPGASNAINLALHAIDENKNKKIFLFKEILHNPVVLNDFKSKGISTIDDLSKIDNESIIILRAHGEPKELYNYLIKNNIQYKDGTCVKVKEIHELVNKKNKEGYKIILIGNKTHSEIIGTSGWCDMPIIIEDMHDIDNLKVDYNNKYFICFQTTFNESACLNYVELIKKKLKNVEVSNTICDFQNMIHDSSIKLAKKVDLMIVIGGKNSSNTKVLFSKVKEIVRSYHVEDKNELKELVKEIRISKDTKIGLTGGASTPKKEIEDCYEYIKAFISI